MIHADCCVNVIHQHAQTVTQIFRIAGGWTRSEQTGGYISHFQKQPAPTYRSDLRQDDPFGDSSWALQTDPQIRSVLDAPWSEGTLSISSPEPNAFATRDIETLSMLAATLSETFVRLEDLHVLQERNRELKESESRYRDLADTLPIGVVHSMASGGSVYFNPHAKQMTGYTIAELTKMSIGDLYVDPADRDELMRKLEE